VEGESTWETSFTETAPAPLIPLGLIEDSDYYYSIGGGFYGIINSVEIITFTGEIPVTRDYAIRKTFSITSISKRITHKLQA
jgi:hypothetical protein